MNLNLSRYICRAVGILLLLAAAMPARAGLPMVRNFPRSLYGAGAQNWAVAQDSLGRMYFGNRFGLLMFDSQSWRLWRLPNYSTVRAIYLDGPKERIYVGGSEDFGYFEADALTHLPVYRSLTPTISVPGTNFSEIWQIHRVGSDLWFQSDFKMMRYDGRQTDVVALSDKITTSAVVGNRLMAGLMHGGLVEVTQRRSVDITGAAELKGKRIVAILPARQGGAVIATAFDGLYHLDTSDRLTPIDSPVNRYLTDNQAFCGAYDAVSGMYAFGTVANGVAIMSSLDAQPTYINVSGGMSDNTVLTMAFDRDHNLWLGLDNGIDYVVSNSAISRLPLPPASLGAGYASLLQGSQMLLATNRGLYRLPYPMNASTPTPEPLLKGQIWSLDSIAGDVFACGDNDLWVERGGRFIPIKGVGGSWSVAEIPGKPGKLLVSTYIGFVLLERGPSGEWQLTRRISGYNDAGGHFIIDSRNNLWMAHWMRGIYRLQLASDEKRFHRVELLTTRHGLPTNRNNVVSMVDGDPIFSTEGGFYTFNYASGRFEQADELNKSFSSIPSARLYTDLAGALWAISPDHVWRLTRRDGHPEELDSTSYQSMGERIIPGFDHLRFLTPSSLIMSSQDGFYDIDLEARRTPERPGNLFVARVSDKSDSTLYVSGIAPHSQPELKVAYRHNSLIFDMALPEYRAENAVSYSFMLEGLDKEWSRWSTISTKEYPYLSEGSYTLHVRARDAYSGRQYTTDFRFTVSPPWYRSIIAKILYFLIACAAGWGIYPAVKRSARRQADAVERRKEEEMTQLKRDADEQALRKDYEIAHLKSEQLEHDIKHKSEELSNITMNVIRKNEILLDIATKLTKVQEAMGPDAAEAKQIARIQRLIQDNMSHDDDWRSFTRNFDIVYENYTKRLIELHPDLNSSDLRICCYLKMGLSSKEIAPLFNISYRSVEMTRYRLRKKLGLERETNLVDYLQKI